MLWGIVVGAIILIGRFTPYEPVRDFFNSFGWVTKHAIELTRNLFERYGELTIFLAPMLENTLFIGAIIPGTLVMILGGIATENGLIDLRLAIPLAVIGAIIGDTISYWIGRFGWQRLGPESRLVKWAEGIREPLMNHSVWLILSYHFAGYSRLIGPASSGFLRVPFTRWMLLDYIGVTLWVITFMMTGYVLGMLGLNINDPSERDIRIFELILFALLVIGVLAVFRRSGKKERDGEDVQISDEG
ncbi:MAG: DedA family protein [Dehalococcoidia bacterium]